MFSDGSGTFAFATRGREPVSRGGFAGYGEVESVEGSYKLYTGVLISVQ